MTVAGAVVLAGGQAQRLPGKVLLDGGADEPLVARVVRQLTTPAASDAGAESLDAVTTAFVRGTIELVVSSSRALAPALSGVLRARVVIDRWEGRGPLGGILSAFHAMTADWILVAAADTPFIDAAFAARLARRRRDGDDAVVPLHHGDRLEPLAALYRRDAVLRAGPGVLAGGASLQTVLRRITARTVTIGDAERVLLNVNTPADYHAFKEALQ